MILSGGCLQRDEQLFPSRLEIGDLALDLGELLAMSGGHTVTSRHLREIVDDAIEEGRDLGRREAEPDHPADPAYQQRGIGVEITIAVHAAG